MSNDIYMLLVAATTIACLHTLSGPDHYLPFIALSKARGWSFARTLFWTAICGCGHVWSSVLLGLGGAAIGWSLSKVDGLESVRGGLASWALLGFGLMYSIWGIYRAVKTNGINTLISMKMALYMYTNTGMERLWLQKNGIKLRLG